MEEVAEFVSRLPVSDAIARVCNLLRHLGGLGTVASEDSLRLVEAWLANPQEPLRMEAWRRADALDYQSVDGLMLASVAWTGGSLADPKVSRVPPPASLPGEAAGGAARLAISEFDPDDAEMLRIVARCFPEVVLPSRPLTDVW